MQKTLVLAEKPSVGREIARVLGCKTNKNGSIHGEKYIVTWALGHLVTLADPEHYGNIYKTWSMETLPMLPKKMELEVIKQTSKQFLHVCSLLKRSEVSSVVIATDAGREGELVARWIIMKSGVKKPLKRLWISSQTDKAIKDGFANLKDADDYYTLFMSAQARAEADWYVGLNVTRALTCKFNAQLSAGRVQTPTLALIVNRENEIRKFRPKDFYTITAKFAGFSATYADEKGNSAIFDKETADKILSDIKDKPFKVLDIKRTKKRTLPPALYDLTELQRDANKLYAYSAKQTLSFMQSLYEHHKLLTYPRTDSRYITNDIVPTLGDRVKAVNFGEFAPHASAVIRGRKNISKSCVNNAKVSDHHAIIPTELSGALAQLSPEERRIYSLVVKRFLVSFFEPYEYESLKITLKCENYTFTATGKAVINQGFKAVYDLPSEDEADEPSITLPVQGAALNAQTAMLSKKQTTPPARYTEATLLSAMENPSKFISDLKMKEIMQKSSGLGTPATRADIIEKLFDCFYVERRGKDMYPTSKGIQLIGLVPEKLKSPELTANWEEKLEQIRSGKTNIGRFISEIKDYAAQLVNDVKFSEEKYIHDKFIEWGVRFVTVVDHADSNDPSNKKNRQITGLTNEWYLEDLSNNIKKTFNTKRKCGDFVGSFAPFGYLKQRDMNNVIHLIIDPIASEIVKRIYNDYINGLGLRTIAKGLNDDKVLSPSEYKWNNGEYINIPTKKYENTVLSKSGGYIIKCNYFNENLKSGTTINHICKIDCDNNLINNIELKLHKSNSINIFYTTDNIEESDILNSFNTDIWIKVDNVIPSNVKYIWCCYKVEKKYEELFTSFELNIEKNQDRSIGSVLKCSLYYVRGRESYGRNQT